MTTVYYSVFNSDYLDNSPCLIVINIQSLDLFYFCCYVLKHTKSGQDFDSGPIPLYKLAFIIYLDDFFGRKKTFSANIMMIQCCNDGCHLGM